MTTYLFYYCSGFVESRRLPDWLTRDELREECHKLGAVAWGECDAHD